MTLQTLLSELVNEAPSRGIGDVDVYISDEKHDTSYKIIRISNEGNNDGIFIEIRKTR